MHKWRQACRSLFRRPAFAFTVAGLLTLGIGANTALFSVVNTVLLKPLPYPDSSRLVTVYEASPATDQRQSLIAPARLHDWNRLNRTFTYIAGSYSESVTDTSGEQPERLAGRRVSPRYFQVFETQPALGRTFTGEEEREGGPLTAIVSHAFWMRRFNLSPSLLGRRLVIAGRGVSIVGVMPEDFAAPSVDVWLPAQVNAFLLRVRDARFLGGVGRMKPGVTVAQAQDDLDRVQQILGQTFPRTDKGWSAAVQDLKEARVGDSRKALALLFGAVLLLLSITVANVAGLVMAQFDRRERELAIRTFIGASRGQVVVALMREMAILAAAGGAGGWALAALSIDLLKKLLADVPRMPELQLDLRAFLFALAATAAGAMFFGLLPALRATAADRMGMFLRAGRGIAGGRHALQRAMVAAQIAVTVVLLASSALLLRSFYNLSHVETGFQPDHTVVFHVGAAWDEDRGRIARMQEKLIADLQRLPGVTAAGMTNFLPASGATLRYEVALQGAAQGATQGGKFFVGWRTVSPGYLKALRVPLTAGRWCPELRANATSPSEAMVNRRFVDLYAQGQNPVGRLIGSGSEGSGIPAMTIAGVIGDMREDALNSPAYPYVYFCGAGGTWPDPEYVVRASGDPLALMNSIRETVRNIDPTRAVFGVKPLAEAIDQDLNRPRSNARTIALFGFAAVVLAAVGLYGLMTQTVNARRQEIGVRMALGADRTGIVRMILGGAAALVLLGLAAGLGLTLAAERLLRSLLFGVAPTDTLSLAGAAGLLLIVCLLAALLPATRAAAIDPMDSLRAE